VIVAQLDLFSAGEPDTSTIADQAARHAEMRRRSVAGLCQACGRPIDAEWLGLSFGWHCRACEQAPIADEAGALTKAGWLLDTQQQTLEGATWHRGGEALTVPHAALGRIARWVRSDPRLSAAALLERLAE
jgi:hypothetical protein